MGKTTVLYTWLLSGGNGVRFTMASMLTSPAKNGKGQDNWSCAITCDYAGSMVTEYHMGIGHRRLEPGNKPFPQGRISIYDWDRSRPVSPGIREVLWSLAMDLQTLRDLPADELSAADELAKEFGMGLEGKPMDALRMVRAMRKTQDDMTKLLRGTGIDLRDFVDYWSNEDNHGEE